MERPAIRSAMCASLAILGLLLAPHSAQAELVKQLKINGQVLVLNGAGTRSKAFVQLYESGLYLAKPAREAKAIIVADEQMAIRVKIKSGFVSQSTLVSSLADGLRKSTNGDVASIQREAQQFRQFLKDEVRKNDIYDFVYMPPKGLFVIKNGQVKGSIPGIAFKKALFGIWLSDKPADAKLRQAMLSGGATR